MQTKVKHQKWLAMIVAIVLFVGTFSIFSVFSASSTNLLETLADKVDTNTYPVDEATNTITVSDTAGAGDHFPTYTGITLDQDKTYIYEFTINFSDISAGQIRLPIRKSSGFDAGQWLGMWFSEGQVRLATDYWSNSGGVAGSLTYAANTDYRVKVVSEPLKATVYVNDTKIVEKTYDSKVANGSIGFGGWGLKQYTLKNVSLTEQKAEAASANLLETLADKVDTNTYPVDEATNTITVSDTAGAGDHFPTYTGITLDQDKTYIYEFTINFSDISAGQIRLPIRKSSGFDAGQWLGMWFSEGQVRLATDYWSNSGGVAGSLTYAANTDYRVKVVSEPLKVTVYVNDAKIVEKTYDSKVANGSIGFGGWGLKQYTLKNVSLTEQKEEAVNLLAGAAVNWDTAKYTVDAATNSITVKEAGDHAITFTNASLDKKGIYEYSFTLNIKEADSIQLRMPIRASKANDQAASGQWMAAWFSLNQIRLATEYSGNAMADGSSVGTQVIQAGTDYQFKIVTSPTQMIVYVNGTQIAQTQADSYTPVETGYVGFGGYGMKEYTLKNISLVKTGEVEVLIDQAAVDNVKALISAIGTVTEASGDKITAARTAYDALNNDEKALIDNYATLTEAEAAYTTLSASSDYHYYPVAISDLLGYNHWQGAGMLSTAALSGGGVRFNFNDAGTNIRMGINKPLQIDGMHFELANLSVSEGGRIAFYLANLTEEGYSQLNTSFGYKFAPMAIVLDTTKGTIEYMSVDWTPDPNDPNTTGTVVANELAQSDSLKAENLANKNISVRLSDNKDGSYQVTIQGVSGTITKAMLDTTTLLDDYNDAYLTLSTNGTGQTLSFDLISLHGGQETCASSLSKEETEEVDAVISLIEQIGDVTAESGDKIAAAENAYNALTDTQKGLVNNYGALGAAKLLYDRINATDVYQDIKYYSLTSDDLMGTNHWGDMLQYSDAPGGGVHFKWFNGGSDVRMGINRAAALDGLHLVLDNLSITSGSTIAFYLADLFDFDWAEQYSNFYNGGGPLVLLLDTKAGTLSVAYRDSDENVVQKTIISDTSLTYSMLSKVQFDLKITKNANDDNYTVRVLDAEGTITAEMVESAKNLTKLDKVYVTVCPWGSGVSVEYDLLALHGGNVVCADEITSEQKAELEAVVAAIVNIFNAKGQVDAASGAKIDKAWALYDELPVDIKALVSNLKDLEEADEVYQVVKAIENIGTVTLDSKELIESIRAEYKALTGPLNGQVGNYDSLDVSKRSLVGNYAKLNAAIAQLYGLEKEAAIAAMQNGGSNNQGGSSPDTGASANGAFALACLISAAGAAIVLRKRNVSNKTASK